MSAERSRQLDGQAAPLSGTYDEGRASCRHRDRRRAGTTVSPRGYHGRYYREPDQARHSTASWGNERSFWPRPRALYRMLDERGYDVLATMPFYLPTRTFFLCLPRADRVTA